MERERAPAEGTKAWQSGGPGGIALGVPAALGVRGVEEEGPQTWEPRRSQFWVLQAAVHYPPLAVPMAVQTLVKEALGAAG